MQLDTIDFHYNMFGNYISKFMSILSDGTYRTKLLLDLSMPKTSLLVWKMVTSNTAHLVRTCMTFKHDGKILIPSCVYIENNFLGGGVLKRNVQIKFKEKS